MNSRKEQFIDWIKEECKKNNIKYSLRNVSYVILNGNMKCSGYFYNEEDKGYLVCAMRKNGSVEILAHEYCHATQWLDKISLWDKSTKSLTKLEEWLSGKRVKNIKEHLAVCRDLELDNEKRTAKLLEDWDIGVDINHYTKKANAYVMYYNYLNISKKWCSPGNTPYTNSRLINAMSTKFDMDYENLSDEIKNIFIEEKI